MAIANAEKAAAAIDKLPKPDDAKRADKDDAEQAKALVDALTENKNSMLGEDALDKLDDVIARIEALEKISFAPSIIEGAGLKWNADTATKGARFVSDAEFDEFVKMLVDGKEIAAAQTNPKQKAGHRILRCPAFAI